MKFLILAAAILAVASCAQPDHWSKGYPPQRPEGVMPGSPNWYQRL